ncbi:MAG: HAD family phosphatase [Acetobacter sp.]|nr:HAD family phosphatase [Acetobacter sp.]
MPPIKYAIFDVGQTIYPFSLVPLIEYMQKETLEPDFFANQHTPRFYDYNPYMKGAMTNTEFTEELCFFCRVPYHKNRLAEINTALHQGCGKRFPETLKAMHQLKQNGAEICLLSNALPLLADTGADLVKPQYAFTSYELKLLKPDYEIFQAVLEKLKIKPEQTLFIDDKKTNVEAAQSLGINGIVYTPNTILKELTSYLQPLPKISRSREV